MYETWYKMTVMLQSGLDIHPVITHRFPFADYKRAIATSMSKAKERAVKVVVEYAA